MGSSSVFVLVGCWLLLASFDIMDAILPSVSARSAEERKELYRAKSLEESLPGLYCQCQQDSRGDSSFSSFSTADTGAFMTMQQEEENVLFIMKEGQEQDRVGVDSSSSSTCRPSAGSNGRDFSLPIWAYENKPIPIEKLEASLCRLSCDQTSTGDFDLAILVRILHLVNTEPGADFSYEETILTALAEKEVAGELSYWLEPGERYHCYWSENHMILWMSSAYLIRQWTGQTMDDQLDVRLQHFLETKLEYGFYEFFSTNYNGYTLGALLNLYDFCADAGIRELAGAVAVRMMEEWLLVANERAAFFPATARNFNRHYFDVVPSSILWLTAELGGPEPPATRNDFVGAFLATSGIDLDAIGAKWSPTVDTVLTVGHPDNGLRAVHRRLSFLDQVMFQWSSGGYFSPGILTDTVQILRGYDLYGHLLWPNELREAPTNALALLQGSSIAGATVHIYKNGGVGLSSLEDFNAGMLAGQQYSWAATVEDFAIWTQAGVSGDCMEPDLASLKISNTHLPKVSQQSNVALILYRPRLEYSVLAFPFMQVALFWPSDRFEEEVSVPESNWIVGRKGNSYVAVWRDNVEQNDCEGREPCEAYYYSNPGGLRRAQMWAVVVGNNVTHGSFESFLNVIRAARMTKQFFLFRLRAKLSVDGKNIRSVM